MNDPRLSLQAAALVEEAQDYYKALLRPIYAGRKFLHAGAVAVGLGNQARMLGALGAARPFLIADGEGSGQMPTAAEAELCLLNIDAKSIIDQHRQSEAALQNLSAEVQAAVDAWDPEHAARWICSVMLQEVATVAGRRKYAPREPAWTAFEDKIAIDAFWDAIGVRRAPSRIVAAEPQALAAAASDLDRGLGTVWAADAREGVHGGAEGLRWVRPGDDGRAAAESLRDLADRARVMPFLEGIPVSIHGIVFPDFVAVFRPVEMVILRPPAGDRFLYAGCANWFDPPAEDREAMRALARTIGAALRDQVGYSGAFTVDGVLSGEGFLPTELNPRIGGGLRTLASGLGDLPLTPLCWAVTEGEATHLDYRPELLERAVLASADACRVGGGWTVTSAKFEDSGEFPLVRDGDEYREACPGEEPLATMTCGPGPLGGFLAFRLDPERNEPGASAAPEVVRALRFADRRLGTDFGALTAAQDVRR